MAVFRKKPAACPDDDVTGSDPASSGTLAHLVGRVRDAAPALEARDVEAALVHARLADHYRDLGLAPPAAGGFRAADGRSRRRRLAPAGAGGGDAR